MKTVGAQLKFGLNLGKDREQNKQSPNLDSTPDSTRCRSPLASLGFVAVVDL